MTVFTDLPDDIIQKIYLIYIKEQNNDIKTMLSDAVKKNFLYGSIYRYYSFIIKSSDDQLNYYHNIFVSKNMATRYISKFYKNDIDIYYKNNLILHDLNDNIMMKKLIMENLIIFICSECNSILDICYDYIIKNKNLITEYCNNFEKIKKEINNIYDHIMNIINGNDNFSYNFYLLNFDGTTDQLDYLLNNNINIFKNDYKFLLEYDSDCHLDYLHFMITNNYKLESKVYPIISKNHFSLREKIVLNFFKNI